MLRILIAILILLTTQTLADPPEIAALSDLSINEAFADFKIMNNGGGLVMLMDNKHLQASNSWSRSVWNDESFAEVLQEQKITVVYIDGKSHPAIFAMLKPRSTPATYYWYQGKIKAKRFGYSIDDTPERMLKWLKLARQSSSLSKEMINQLKDTPNDIDLRFKLIEELNREDNENEILLQFCWLFEHNEVWFQHAIKSDDARSQNVNNPEMSFRASLWWFIMAGRDNLGLFKETMPQFEGAPPRDGWEEAFLYVDHEENYTAQEESWKPYVVLRRTLESKRDNNTATDRDLFVLKALTVEGEEGRALAEEMRPFFE